MIIDVIAIILFYIIGSFPSALVVGKFKHVDIRQHGSGNLGSTNALRVMGKKYGAIVFALDVLKGFLPMFIIKTLCDNGSIELSFAYYYLGIVLCLGHCYPIFAGFRGGKAVATSLGILLSINAFIGLTAVLVFILVTVITKIVALGSTFAFIYAVSLLYIMRFSVPVLILGTVLLLLVIYKHIPNYKRILKHQENKIGAKKNKIEN